MHGLQHLINLIEDIHFMNAPAPNKPHVRSGFSLPEHPLALCVLAALVLLACVGGVYAFGHKTIHAKITAYHCNKAPQSEECHKRIRALGHLHYAAKEYDKAEYWYHFGAMNQDAEAMFHLAWLMHLQAIDARNALVVSERTLNLAAIGAEKRASVMAVFQLRKNAQHWYEQSANAGFSAAMNNLGQLHLTGVGNHKNEKQAHDWHKKAATAGNPVGQMNTMLDLLRGQGVEQNSQQAAQWEMWNAARIQPSEIAAPILERSFVHGQRLSSEHIAQLRHAAATGGKIKTDYTLLRKMGIFARPSPLVDVPAPGAEPRKSFQDVLQSMEVD